MWISKKEYKKLIDENQSLKQQVDYTRTIYRDLGEQNIILSRQYSIANEQLEQLKVKYADEVKKNFELASYLSKIKKD